MMKGPLWEWGKAAETAVRKSYLKMGWFVVPAHAIEDGGAPLLIGKLKNYVLPDFLIAKGGMPRWLEVKLKDHCAKYQKAQQWRHGIDLPKWEHYCAVERETGIPGSIAILQLRPGPLATPAPCLLVQTLERLEKVLQRDPRPTPSAPHGMCYWAVDDMDVVADKLDFRRPVNATEFAHKIHAWDRKSKMGDAPQWQQTRQSRFDF